MAKQVLFGSDAISKIRAGINVAANAVSRTLGPKGMNVFIDDSLMPNITNDGVTIANTITLEDKFENMGAHLVKNTAAQTNELAGDGTTTTTVLLKAVTDECFARQEHPMVIEKSLTDAVAKYLPLIKDASQKISSKKDIKRIALISSKSENISDMICEIIEKKGKDTIITVDDSRTGITSYEITQGYEAQVGYLTPYCVTDAQTQRAIYKDTHVLCAEKKIGSLGDLKVLFDQLERAHITSLVIVCEEIEATMLGFLMTNKLRGIFNTLVIRATGELLEDIATVTNATIVSDKTGVTWGTVDIKKHLGMVEKVTADQKKSIFVANHKSAKEQIKRLIARKESAPNQFEKKSLDKRIAKLQGSIAVIRIGAPTDLEREYWKYKAEDAINAVKSALEEGIVEGGGMCLYRISQEINPTTCGEEILKKVLTAPLRKIIENAGKDYTEIVKALPKGYGYDAKNDTYVMMIPSGIIDPAKVERVALTNAVSTVSKLITMHAAIADKEDKNAKTNNG